MTPRTASCSGSGEDCSLESSRLSLEQNCRMPTSGAGEDCGSRAGRWGRGPRCTALSLQMTLCVSSVKTALEILRGEPSQKRAPKRPAGRMGFGSSLLQCGQILQQQFLRGTVVPPGTPLLGQSR